MFDGLLRIGDYQVEQGADESHADDGVENGEEAGEGRGRDDVAESDRGQRNDREVQAVGEAPVLSEAVEDESRYHDNYHRQCKRLVAGVAKGAVERPKGGSILGKD